MNLRDKLRGWEQKIALVIGFAAVAAIGFWGGMNMDPKADTSPAVSASSSSTNYTESKPVVQTPVSTTQTSTTQALEVLDCGGKIKGSSSHIYHVPGGSFYNKTTRPIACFDTEAEAQVAGFRKSSR